MTDKNEETRSSPQDTVVKISSGEKLAYGLGDLAQNFVYSTTTVFLLIFYTDVVGFAPATVSIIMLVARLWDAINDPMMGMILDRTQSRWGKFRPYILFGALPFGIFGVLSFTTLNASMNVRLIYALFTYIALGMIFTVVNTAYGALTSAMTQDPVERTRITGVRIFMAILGSQGIATVIPILVPALGQGNDGRGYALSMTIFSIIAVILLIITFKGTRERVVQPVNREKISMRHFFSNIKRNDQLIILCFFFLFLFFLNAIVNSVGTYYFTYVLKKAELFSLYSLIFGAGILLGIPLLVGITQKIGKKRAITIGLLSFIIGPLSIGIFTYNLPVIMVARFFSGLGIAAAVTIWGLVPDTIEYSEWKIGVRAEGAVYSIIGFFLKLGLTLGGIIPGIILSISGYVANTEQTTASIRAIIALNAWLPIGIIILSIIIFSLYKLDEKTYLSILNEIKERQKDKE